MTVDDPLNLVLALATASTIKYIGASLCRLKKLATYEFVGKVTALDLYPVKSCGAISLQSANCTRGGLKHSGVTDRHWMVVRDGGVKVNIQQEPKMTLITPSIHGNKLCFDAPGMPTLKVEKNPKEDPSLYVDCKPKVKAMTAMNCGKEASEWISKYLGIKGAYIVVSTENMAKRDVSELVPRPWLNVPETTDKVTFSEVSMCNIAFENSLKDLNSRLANPVSMGNFRPNIIINGSLAFDEDNWLEMRIGDSVYMRILEPNPRCLLITVAPDGKRDSNAEPLKTLRKFRKTKPYGDSPLFGVNTAIDREGIIKIGDPVYVLRKPVT
ncbi:mitochondrial amidoxime reducing component 2-like isoform X1 [Mytilus californianus]|uniref:mitochondrial amidoxime reducing component 2-like isoform X1 n=1 Tax=Mytilus californianus TaxID=6549 RepID=UPI002248487F|nr:mitochondrial amidoxime reducing component 2-like isoform X1 [Mytilus californianus]